MALKMLRSANSDSAETRLALNHPSPRNSVKDSDAAQELGCDMFWSLPYDESIADRDEAGRPAVICSPKARISRSISKMASLLSEAGSPSSADRVRASGSTFLGRVLRTSS
jgi:Flp pilus assembly CpaE family ATPase